MPRYKPSDKERNEIMELITTKQPDIQEPTKNKIVSVLYHLKESVGKPLDLITLEDVTSYMNSKEYSKKTCLWINSLFRKYLNINCNYVNSEPSYEQQWLTEELLHQILTSMFQDIQNGHPETSSLIIIVISLLCCQKTYRVQKLSLSQVLEILDGEIVLLDNFIFTKLPHMSLTINGEDISEKLKTVIRTIRSIDENYILLPPSSLFLKNNMGKNLKGAGYTEFYKYSRDKLLSYLSRSAKQEIGAKFGEIEKSGFACNREYFMYLFSQIVL